MSNKVPDDELVTSHPSRNVFKPDNNALIVTYITNPLET